MTSPGGGTRQNLTVRFSPFDRGAIESGQAFTRIGRGEIGGKATGLALIQEVLEQAVPPSEFPGVTVKIPDLTVIATDLFDAFLEDNGLWDIALSDQPDVRIAHAFQRASLPARILGDLRALAERTREPLAVRSSSLLEDALDHPFAGVYGTKMIANNQFEPDTRFRKLVEAVKFVYASTFFARARNYQRVTGHNSREEKMAVILQEIVGARHHDRFYPDISGVARSYNFYPTGHARPDDGVVHLALGLGKTVVEGGVCWSFAPSYPRSLPPFGSPSALLDHTQTQFWAVNMGGTPSYDPVAETEYLVYPGISEAEADGVLPPLVSTYDPAADRLVSGMAASGPRALTFAPILVGERLPLTEIIRKLLPACERAVGAKVEIEFAIRIDPGATLSAQFGFLQVRPLALSTQFMEVSAEQMRAQNALVASDSTLGNGTLEGICDIVYVEPDRFDTRWSRTIAAEVEEFNRRLSAERRPYLLIGFGRWGSADPWLGIPVDWSQISGARAIVEATRPDLATDPSQGSHFFHNLTSFRVAYFSVPHTSPYPIRFDWLDALPAGGETEHVRHVRLEHPLEVLVDGRTGRGVILFPEAEVA
jgi:hypothetical protein